MLFLKEKPRLYDKISILVSVNIVFLFNYLSVICDEDVEFLINIHVKMTFLCASRLSLWRKYSFGICFANR